MDELGLDRLDRAVLGALVSRFGGGPVGLSTLAVAVGEEAETVEEVAEPFLVRAGLLARTPRGRVATPAAWAAPGPAPDRGPGAARPGRAGQPVRVERHGGSCHRAIRRAGGLVARMSRSVARGHSLLVRHPCAATLRQLVNRCPSGRVLAAYAGRGQVAWPAQSTSTGRKPRDGALCILAATSSPAKREPYTFLIIIVVLFGLLYFVMIRPQRNRQRQARRCRARSCPARGSAPRPACTPPWSSRRTRTWCWRSPPGCRVRFLRRADHGRAAGRDGRPD